MLWLGQALDVLSRGERCVLVTVAQVKGSAPRETGAKMLVWLSGMAGSVGGGRLEFQAVALARRMLAVPDGSTVAIESFSLGPELNQCCGGQVGLVFEALDESALPWLRAWAKAADAPEPCATVLEIRGQDATRQFVRQGELDSRGLPTTLRRSLRAVLEGSQGVEILHAPDSVRLVEPVGERLDPVMLFGAGHVGRAVARALAPLPFRVTWVDSRDDAFPAELPPRVVRVVSASPPRDVLGAPPGTHYLVMTHSHPLDLEICAQVLRRESFAFLGLIGSETKRARFAGRLRAAGIAPHLLSRLTCPIGVPGIGSKEPAAIAAAVAAQLLIVAEQRYIRSRPILTTLEVGT